MLKLLSSLFGRDRPFVSAPARPRLHIELQPAVAYAIGDIHGRYDLLQAMEAAIVAEAGGVDGDKLVVVLGDVIDRGPESRKVVDHLMRPPPSGFRRIVLAGNHEQMLLDFLSNPSAGSLWLELGGAETLLSYGVRPERVLSRGTRPAQLARDMQTVMPSDHVAWLQDLPTLVTFPGHAFVHAGVEQGIPLDDQRDDVLMSLRLDQAGPAPVPGKILIHGHVPADHPVVEATRICADTGAYATGVLTAVRIAPDTAPHILQVRL